MLRYRKIAYLVSTFTRKLANMPDLREIYFFTDQEPWAILKQVYSESIFISFTRNVFAFGEWDHRMAARNVMTYKCTKLNTTFLRPSTGLVLHASQMYQYLQCMKIWIPWHMNDDQNDVHTLASRLNLLSYEEKQREIRSQPKVIMQRWTHHIETQISFHMNFILLHLSDNGSRTTSRNVEYRGERFGRPGR
jgi:hypothetical protein